MTSSTYPIRLSQYLFFKHPSRFPSETSANSAIDAGKVSISTSNGAPAAACTEAQTLVYPDTDTLHIALDGPEAKSTVSPVTPISTLLTVSGPCSPPTPTIYFMDKPRNSVCDMSIKTDPITVACKALGPFISPIGQLDVQTTGLLLLTDAPGVSRLVSLPGALSKVYRVSFDAAASSAGLSKEQAAALTTPTDLTRDNDRPTIASFSKITRMKRRYIIDNPKLPEGIEPKARFSADCTISSGQNHIVKRLFASAKSAVRELRRVAIGPIKLPELPDEPEAGDDEVPPPPKKRLKKGENKGKKGEGGAAEPPAAVIPVRLSDELRDALLAAIDYEETGAALRRCDLICRSRQAERGADERLIEWLNLSKEEQKQKCYHGFSISCRVKHE